MLPLLCYASFSNLSWGEANRHTLLVAAWFRDKRSVSGGISAERFLELDMLCCTSEDALSLNEGVIYGKVVYGKGNSNGMETRIVHFNRMATLLDAMLIARVPIDSNTIEVMIMQSPDGLLSKHSERMKTALCWNKSLLLFYPIVAYKWP